MGRPAGFEPAPEDPQSSILAKLYYGLHQENVDNKYTL